MKILSSATAAIVLSAIIASASAHSIDANPTPVDCGDSFQDDCTDIATLIPGPFPVPVPATLALFGLGLAGLGYSRRKKA